MKRTWIGALLALTACGTVTEEPQVFDILAFGAVGDGVTECTAAVQAAIDSCTLSGGGTVLVPEGTFLCRTLYLKDRVDLHLDKGAVLRGIDDPEAYASFLPQHDLSMYDSGGNSANANNTGDRRWMKAFLQGNGIEGASITGEGLIDGRHVFDSLGEENMRGPHTIIVGEAKDFRIEGVSITRAANYAFLGYALKNAVFKGMHITEGWDGIHIRGGKHVEIADCLFETGDDAIAGGYWEGMLIRDCEINSSCNGVRMIMPSDGVEIRDCHLYGPGVYPHRTSGEARRNNMLFGISLEPGAWGEATGTAKGIHLHDLRLENLSSPVSTSVREGSVAEDLTLENITATGLTGALTPVVSWNDQGFKTITLRNVTLSR